MLILGRPHIIQKLEGLVVTLLQIVLMLLLVHRDYRRVTPPLLSLEPLESREELEPDQFLVHPLHLLVQQLEQVDLVHLETTAHHHTVPQNGLLNDRRQVQHPLLVGLSGLVTLQVEALQYQVLYDAALGV